MLGLCALRVGLDHPVVAAELLQELMRQPVLAIVVGVTEGVVVQRRRVGVGLDALVAMLPIRGRDPDRIRAQRVVVGRSIAVGPGRVVALTVVERLADDAVVVMEQRVVADQADVLVGHRHCTALAVVDADQAVPTAAGIQVVAAGDVVAEGCRRQGR